MKLNYTDKLEGLKKQTLFFALEPNEQQFVEKCSHENQFTLQELKKIVETVIDLRMWGEDSFDSLWSQWRAKSELEGREFKKWAFNELGSYLNKAKNTEISFKEKPQISAKYKRSKAFVQKEYLDDTILGMCPVASKKTVCCNLRTLDAVKNCGFGCSYCSIQTMFTKQEIIFDEHFEDKLEKIQLDPIRYYHIGTGQSSDAMLWGNQFHILDSLFKFARKWPNVLLEFKTKSKNIKHFLKSDVPKNVFCSWSLNPDQVIQNEEHLTATLEERLASAEALVQKGMKVGFHFHPIVYFEGWEEEYAKVVSEVTRRFKSEDTIFVSLGTLTFPKPIIKKIRTYDIQSKILKMPMVPNPEGKLTYPVEIKNRMFKYVYNQFKEWHGKVFFYLCMEERQFWLETFGGVYETNELFEQDMFRCVWPKINGETPEHAGNRLTHTE